MKLLVALLVGVSVIGLAACSSQKSGEAKGDVVNVQAGDSSTKIDQDGNVSVQTGDSSVNVQGGNVDVQGEGGSVKIKDGKISIENLGDYMKDVNVEAGEDADTGAMGK